ncbi:phospholipase A1 PLIP2, chloroplastic-like [Phragmites australis]|uniref:phospholipase A1 PLIP2, chloroplastic-like n=1 Tax=Phragmites australis TaxID=29695 RepID=UPI002D782CAE|nr:phospholipase A1 PLIP2, chloroplastic-like [Phragmites australis]
MDALRFVRGAAPPQPPVASPASVPPAAQRRQPLQQPHAPPLRLWPRGGGGGGGEKPAAAGGAVRGAESGSPRKEETDERKADEGRQGNWVLQMLRVQPRWVEAADAEATGGSGGQEPEATGGGGVEECVSCGGGVEEEGCAVGDDESDGEVFDRASFSRLLRKVSLGEAKEYSKMSYLCSIAYMIPRIQPKCLRRYNLRFVTSSVQEKARTSPDEKQEISTGKTDSPDQESEVVENAAVGSKKKGSGLGINPFGAYQFMSSSASYLHSRAMGIMPFGSRNDANNDPTIIAIVNGENGEGLTVDEASFVATTNSVTSMVAAKEETRQAVADDLNSLRSCPCEWFVCDDDQCSTRYFVVQGSESMASWQANLLFEPVKFEELDVLVHRGIYEAAKGIYHQMLPYVKSHLKSHGKSAALRFTGHSLGGSLALLVNLMLLVRGEAPASALLPVVTFGAPCIMCGGDHLLRILGLPRSHVQSITIHRDIVPRVFSCNYPDHVANILKLANGNFRGHPCLTNQKLLYAPMGEVLILQPDKRLSPHHHLLPPDSGIYHLGDSSSSGVSLAQLRSAVSAFLNSPHPLEILKDGGAYGPRGSVYRDHDVNSYLRSVRAVVRKEARRAREAERERLLLLWPFGVSSSGAGRSGGGGLVDAALQGGRETARRVQRHARLFVVLLAVRLR